MSESPWPPSPSPGDRWVVVPVLDESSGRLSGRQSLRLVRLWGKWVPITAGGLVWCSSCSRLVGVGELGRPDNHHTAGLPFRTGMLLASDDDDEPPPSPRPELDRW